MENDVFEQSISVTDGPLGVREIGCAMEAIEFLEEWPHGKRCPLHARAIEACCAAYDGRDGSAAAGRAFEAWARSAGVSFRAALQLEAVERAGIFEIC